MYDNSPSWPVWRLQFLLSLVGLDPSSSGSNTLSSLFCFCSSAVDSLCMSAADLVLEELLPLPFPFLSFATWTVRSSNASVFSLLFNMTAAPSSFQSQRPLRLILLQVHGDLVVFDRLQGTFTPNLSVDHRFRQLKLINNDLCCRRFL